ncbi:MAG: hypothetical protein ACI8QD_000877 [Cyclobacteriaceae bacterium]|jgi:hypothetical protein
MKKLTTTIAVFFALFASIAVYANNQSDTVVIELENNSKIVIYTKNKAQLRDLEDFDINKMIKDLNNSIENSSTNYLELDDDGKKYRKDTSYMYRDGDRTASIRLGKIQLEVDNMDWSNPDDWEELEDRWDDEDDFRKYSYIDTKIDRTKNYFNIDLGTNNWLENTDQFPQDNNQPYGVKPFGSWYVGLNSINKTWIGGPLFLEWGFGVSFFNWKLEDPSYQIVKGADEVEFEPISTDLNPDKSKLSASFVNFQVLPMFDFAEGRKKVKAIERGGVRIKRYKKDGLRIGAGGYAGYRMGSRSKLVFFEDGNKEKDVDKGTFYLNNFRYGVRAQIGWRDIDFFATYDLNEVFSNNRGPKLNAVTFGIIL